MEIVIAEGRDGQAQQAEVNFDGGQAQMLTTGDRIRVHQSEQVVRLLHINKVSFLQMLHKKKWVKDNEKKQTGSDPACNLTI